MRRNTYDSIARPVQPKREPLDIISLASLPLSGFLNMQGLRRDSVVALQKKLKSEEGVHIFCIVIYA